LDQQFYHIGQFARKASVSIRTLRYYDSVGLLSPSHYTEAGYRLYTSEDLVSLQQILALKFLGFSLEEIKCSLQAGPKRLPEVLAQQKAMIREKRAQLDTIVKAIERTEQLLQADQYDWEAIVSVIQAIQMNQKNDWKNKYFTPEQQQKMQELINTAYTEEAQQKLKMYHPGEWTEEDQQRVDEQYAWLAAELKRLVAAGADPASPEAQAVAKLKSDLLFAFTQGDPDIEASLQKYTELYNALPAEEKPVDLAPYSEEETAFLNKALEIYRQHQ
jgi:DNA-binding transcriptional MerR regulator